MWDIAKTGGGKKTPPLPITAVFSFPMLMQERTRSALLESLFEELQLRSRSMMGLPIGEDDKIENGSGGFLENFKVSHSGWIPYPVAHTFLKLVVCPFFRVSSTMLYRISQEKTFFPFLCSFLRSYSMVQGGIPYWPWEVKLLMLRAGV